MYQGGGGLFPAYGGGSQGRQGASSLRDGQRFGEKDEGKQLNNFQRAVKAEVEEEERREEKSRRLEERIKVEENTIYGHKAVNSEAFDDLMDARTPVSSQPPLFMPLGRAAQQIGEPSSSSRSCMGKEGSSPSSSSSSSSSSSEASREKRKRSHKGKRSKKKEEKRERKRRKKEEKRERKEARRRKRRAEFDSDCDERNGSKRGKRMERDGSNAQANVPNIIPHGHYTKNPWRLLKRQEWIYKNSHLVLQPNLAGDSLNRDMTESYHRDVPKYKRLGWILTSGHSSPFPLDDVPAAQLQRQDRYFSRAFPANEKVENHFRKMEVAENADFIPISSQPYSDREAQMSAKIDDVAGANLGKATLEQKAAILRDITNQRDPHNVDAWIKLIRLQKELFEQQEPNGAIMNKKALHDRQLAMVDTAIGKNPTSADLRLERLKLEEDFYGAAVDRVKKEWAEALNRFNSSVKLWRTNIALRQNNRSAFKLSDTLKAMDRCMENMLAYLRGQKKSHAVEEGTEQFIAELIEQRCALLLETGNAHRAVASLQALAEFHFFAPAVDRRDLIAAERTLHHAFGQFWDSLARKIGDNGAVGWTNEVGEGSSTSLLPPLSELLDEEFGKDDAEFKHSIASGYSNEGELWKQYELLAAGYQWWPLRFGEGAGKGAVWREVDYQKVGDDAGIRPLVFLFSKRETAEELVLRLLQLFGAVVPGMEDDSQRGVMRCFSDAFPHCSPDYRYVTTFLYNFLALMMRADGVNVPRLIATYIQTYAKFARQSRGAGNSESMRKALVDSLRAVIPPGNDLHNTVALYLSVIQRFSDDDEGELKRISKKLIAILSHNPRSIWEMEPAERLIYLRMYQFLCEQLGEKAEGGGLTRFGLLTRLAVGGNIHADAASMTPDFIEKAKTKWNQVLMSEESPDLVTGADNNEASSQISWLGSEPAILLELAALFYYEESGHNDLVFHQSIASSPLGQQCGDDKAIYRLRIRVYEHKMRHSSSVTRKDYRGLIWEAVEKFPQDVHFLKKYMSTENCSFVLRNQLDEYQGDDPRTRLVRNCARIYLEWKLYLESADLASAQPNLLRVHSAIERAIKGLEAAEVSPLPDAYLRCLLLFVETKMGRGSRIEETFTLAQKHCPWSMSLVREAAPAASLYKREFLKSVANMAESKGLCIHRSLLEAEILHN